jgi:hypothetical protein
VVRGEPAYERRNRVLARSYEVTADAMLGVCLHSSSFSPEGSYCLWVHVTNLSDACGAKNEAPLRTK